MRHVGVEVRRLAENSQARIDSERWNDLHACAGFSTLLLFDMHRIARMTDATLPAAPHLGYKQRLAAAIYDLLPLC